jgi:hypothetical protein
MRSPVYDGLAGLLCFFRGTRSTPFGPAEELLLDRVKEHVDRATRLFVHTQRLQLTSTYATEALDALDYAVFIVDREVTVRFANRAGLVLLQSRLPFRGTARKLTCGTTRETDAIRTLVAQATMATGAQAGSVGPPRSA